MSVNVAQFSALYLPFRLFYSYGNSTEPDDVFDISKDKL